MFSTRKSYDRVKEDISWHVSPFHPSSPTFEAKSPTPCFQNGAVLTPYALESPPAIQAPPPSKASVLSSVQPPNLGGRQSTAYKASFNETASGQSYSGFNRFITELRAANLAYRDYATTVATNATAGATNLDLTAVQPASMPAFLDSTGFVVHTRIRIGADATMYTVTAVDDVANTIDISPALAANATAGDTVVAVGVNAPDTSPFVPAS